MKVSESKSFNLQDQKSHVIKPQILLGFVYLKCTRSKLAIIWKTSARSQKPGKHGSHQLKDAFRKFLIKNPDTFTWCRQRNYTCTLHPKNRSSHQGNLASNKYGADKTKQKKKKKKNLQSHPRSLEEARLRMCMLTAAVCAGYIPQSEILGATSPLSSRPGSRYTGRFEQGGAKLCP